MSPIQVLNSLIGQPAYLLWFNSRYDHRIVQFLHQGQLCDGVRIYLWTAWAFELSKHRFQLAPDQYNVFLLTCSMKLYAFGGLYYLQFNINHEVQNLITIFLFVVFRGIAAFLHIYFPYTVLNKQMREDEKILYNSYCGTVLFKWDRNKFHKVQKILNLRTNQMSNSTTKNYFAEYPEPYSCKAIFYQNGRINLNGAKSYEALQQTLADCIICVLMQKLPQMDISILEELQVINCSAKFNLDYKIDIKSLQCQLSKEYGQQSKSNYVYLPQQLYQVQKITAMVAGTYCKVTKAHLLPDIQVFVKYINYLLTDYKKEDHQQRKETGIQDQWMKIKKEIKLKSNFVPSVQSEQENRGIYFEDENG